MKIEKKDDGFVYASDKDGDMLWAQSMDGEERIYHCHLELGLGPQWKLAYENKCLSCKIEISQTILNFFDLYSLE